MYSTRYGNLAALAAKTDGACHLCHQPVDLLFYGRTGAYGDETATVDHIIPQRFGGGDEPENLLIAHGTCNSRRGTRDVDEARMELAGTISAPWSAGKKTSLSLLTGTLIGFWAGSHFADSAGAGNPSFSGPAAVLAGAASALLLRSLL